MKNKKVSIIFVSILLLILPSMMSVIQVSAVDVETRLFISAVPNPVGVGQQLNIQWWLAIPNPIAGQTWDNVEVTVEKPDGKTQTFSGLKSDIKEVLTLGSLQIVQELTKYTLAFQDNG